MRYCTLSRYLQHPGPKGDKIADRHEPIAPNRQWINTCYLPGSNLRGRGVGGVTFVHAYRLACYRTGLTSSVSKEQMAIEILVSAKTRT